MRGNRRRVVLMGLLLMMATAILVSRDGAVAKDSYLSDEESDEDFWARLKGPLAYDDPGLLTLIRQEYLSPPSHLPYALQRERTDSRASIYNSYITMDVAYLPLQRLLLKVFKGVKDGFFVEAGAVDGEFLSNTLMLELRQGWTGLLVEADGDTFQALLERHRKAWASHSCLSPLPYPYKEVLIKYSAKAAAYPMMRMYSRGHGVLASHESLSPVNVVNGEDAATATGDVPSYETVQCLPLGSLLLALNVTHVHLVSLDVEGAEAHILQSFPWQRITVDVWLVEHITNHNATNHNRSSDTSNNDHHNPIHDNNVHNSQTSTNAANNSYPNSNDSTRPQQQPGRDQTFVEFFSSKGYVLYPMDTKGLLDNFLFIRRNSSVFRKEFDGIEENGDVRS